MLVGLADRAARWGDEIDEVAHSRLVDALAGDLVARVAVAVQGEQHGVAEPLLGDLGVLVGGAGSYRAPISRIGVLVLAFHGPA